MQELFAEGLLVLNSHNVTLKHDKKIVSRTIEIYTKVLSKMNTILQEERLIEALSVTPNKPLFVLR